MPAYWVCIQVCIIEEGAASPLACLGLIRLLAHLARHWAASNRAVTIVTDCGTGTTAIGGCPLLAGVRHAMIGAAAIWI